VRVGDAVEITSAMLAATLGPGLLGMVYDGLQNPLRALAARDGFFLARGQSAAPLDAARRWTFTPARTTGARLRAGDVIGTVPEHRFTHKIMVPFGIAGELEVVAVERGAFTASDPVARLRDGAGHEHAVTMAQQWPVRRPSRSACSGGV
jgi:V/A-type H+-transporting ATPase subunit A